MALDLFTCDKPNATHNKKKIGLLYIRKISSRQNYQLMPTRLTFFITMCSTVTHEVFIHPVEGKAFSKKELEDLQKGLARNCYRWAMLKAALPLSHPRYTDLECLCCYFSFTTRKTKVQALRMLRQSTDRDIFLNHSYVRVSRTQSLGDWIQSWEAFIKEGPWYGDDDLFVYKVDYADSEDDNNTDKGLSEDEESQATEVILSEEEKNEHSDN